MSDSRDEDEGAPKWSCEYCTYQNYRSALRCTMCAGSKPLFSEDIYRLSPSQPPKSAPTDILSYQPPPKSTLHIARSKTPSPQPPPPLLLSTPLGAAMASPPTNAHSPNRQHAQPPSNESFALSPDLTSTEAAAVALLPNANSGWSCPLCTHLNGEAIVAARRQQSPQRCGQCGQCSAVGGNVDEASRRSEALHNDMNDQLKALSMRTSMVFAGAGAANKTMTGSEPDLTLGNLAAAATPGRRRSIVSIGNNSTTVSPLGSASNLCGSRTNLGASARISPVDMRLACAAGKWSCTMCTYENYPKSQKCSMCGQPKENEAPAALTTAHSNSTNTCNSPNNADAGDVVDMVDTAAAAANALNSNHSAAAAATAAAAAHGLSAPERAADSSGDDSTNCASNYIISNRPATAPSHQRTGHHNRYQLVASSGVGGATHNAADNALPAAAAAAANNCDNLQERRYRQMRRQADWQWLHACMGVVENNYAAVEAYLSCGGNPGRTLTATEVSLLNRSSAFDVGHTLIHLAIRFHRDEMLPMLLTQITGSGPGIKRVPSYVAPDLASDIRRHFANSLRCRKAAFPCQYVGEHATFALPAEIEELPNTIQEQLHDELLDRDAQAQLESSPPALNWSLEITVRLGSRLMVLWNRSAGDCLLDSAMQATWGVFDRDNVLRRALADSLHQCGHIFYARWKEYEMAQAALLHFTLEEAQWQEDWASLLSLARQPGASLEQLHIFTLAHILRRPIVVYGVKYVKSFRGEDIGFARFEGLYLPLLWDQSFCSKSPIALGYTRGHFSALVPVEPYTRIDAACVDAEDVLFLPLMDCEHKLLPIHFLTHAEMGREESIMRQWLDVCVTEGGLLVAQQKLQKRPLLVAQMLEEWLNHYRRIAQVVSGPFNRRRPLNHTGYSSDGDTDEE